METRQRLVVGVIWILVAALIASTMESAIPTDASGLARLGVVVLALFLAGVYLLDPWDVISQRHG